MKNNLLKGLIAQNDLSRSEIAKMLGIHRNTFNLKLAGKRQFTDTEIIKMANYFKVTTDYLLKGE